MLQTLNQQRFLERYCEFCRSPLPGRESEVLIQELVQIVTNPFFTEQVGFTPDGKSILFGTQMLILKNPDTGIKHRIGEFVLKLTRFELNGMWEAGFSFENTTPLDYTDCNHMYTGSYHHPHIMASYHETEYGPKEVTHLCISEGHRPILRHIRLGELLSATRLMQNILHSLGPGAAYHDIYHWPVESGHD